MINAWHGFKLSTLGRRLLLLFVLPHVIFAAAAIPTEAPTLIGLLNGVSLALATGVCAAFLPAVIDIFMKDRSLERGDYLSLGIWLTWFAVDLQAIWSIVWRAQGMPLWMASTDFTSYFLFMRVMGAVFHLAAPGAIENQIPTRRWIWIGILIAIAVAGVLLASFALDRLAMHDLWFRIV